MTSKKKKAKAKAGGGGGGWARNGWRHSWRLRQKQYKVATNVMDDALLRAAKQYGLLQKALRVVAQYDLDYEEAAAKYRGDPTAYFNGPSEVSLWEVFECLRAMNIALGLAPSPRFPC